MLARVNLSTIKALVKDQADMASSTFLTAGSMDTTLTYWINSAVAELHDLLVQSFEDYFVKKTTFTLSGAETYTLPVNLLRVLKVLRTEAGVVTELRRATFYDFTNLQTNGASANFAPMYRLSGNEMYILPSDWTGTITLYYVPQAVNLVQPDDELHYNIPEGWVEFIIADVVARALEKEESDPSPALRRKEMARVRITNMAAGRDSSDPKRQIDRNSQRDNLWVRVRR